MFLTINGKLIDESEAVISAFDHGYLYGVGVFETFRTYEGHPFLFDDHYKRLCESLEMLQIQFPYTYDELLCQVKQTIEANEMKDAYVRLNVSAGAGGVGLKTDSLRRTYCYCLCESN
nr:aminotransferase class IV [Bacillus sp. RAR_GA_16]